MKDGGRNINGVSSSNDSTTSNNKAMVLNGLKAMMMIRKNSSQYLILRYRLREYLLFSKLRSLLPPSQPSQARRTEIVIQPPTEMDLGPGEAPGRDSDEETVSNACHQSRNENEEDSVVFESDDDEDEEGEETSKPFIPSIKIKKMDGSILISTIVLKDVCLTSGLFRILEEEKLDVVFENQFRTETKVAHTIHAKLQSGSNVDALESKLCMWARKGT